MKTTKDKTIQKESKEELSENRIEEGKPTKNANSMNDYRKKEDNSVESIQDKPAEEQQHEDDTSAN